MSESPKVGSDHVAPSASPDENEQAQTGQEEGQQPGDEAMADVHDFEVKEQDRWLPIANVARIMKGALPENAKIAKEAKECMQECVSEFISFITSEASEKCQQEKRKTVNGEDVIFAMTSLGFENYAEALRVYLAKYRETFDQTQPKTAALPGDARTSLPATGPLGAYDNQDPRQLKQEHEHEHQVLGGPEEAGQFDYENDEHNGVEEE